MDNRFSTASECETDAKALPDNPRLLLASYLSESVDFPVADLLPSLYSDFAVCDHVVEFELLGMLGRVYLEMYTSTETIGAPQGHRQLIITSERPSAGHLSIAFHSAVSDPAHSAECGRQCTSTKCASYLFYSCVSHTSRCQVAFTGMFRGRSRQIPTTSKPQNITMLEFKGA